MEAEELTAKKNVHKEEETGTKQEDTADISENTPEANTQEAPVSEKLSAAEALVLRMQKEIDSEENVETVENTSNYTDSNADLPESDQKNVEEAPAVTAEEDNAEKDSIATQEVTDLKTCRELANKGLLDSVTIKPMGAA